MSKVDELKKWVKDEICRFGRLENFIQIVSERDTFITKNDSERRFQFNLYTEEHRYRITAIDSSKDEGYLGCTAFTRKPRAGEDWTRGNDLPDGKFTRETREHIKNGILKYELIELAPKIEHVVDEAKEPVESDKK